MNSARITLTVTHGSLKGMDYVFEEKSRCIIGRAVDCDILLARDYGHVDISRRHCLLEIDPPAIRVRDLGSMNGTYVNGVNIGHRLRFQMPAEADLRAFTFVALKDGDKLRVGDIIFRVQVETAVATPPAMSFR